MPKTMNTNLNFTTDTKSTKIGDDPNIIYQYILIHIENGGIGVQLGRVGQMIIMLKINK